MSVGSDLRSARETRRLTLGEISKNTKIRLDLLVGLENGDLSRWPKQRIYRHGYLRAYAHAVGLDPARALEKFEDEFGDPADPAPVAFRTRRSKPALPAWFRTTGNMALVASMVVLIGLSIRKLPRITERNNAVPFERQHTPSGASAPEPGASTPAVKQSPAPPAVSITEERPPGEIEEAPLPDIEGEILIDSIPSDARVTVNGIGRGQTPLRIRYLPLGSYTVRVISPGYKIGETQVTLKSDQPNRTIRLVLEHEPTLASKVLTSSDGP
jgi:cytoskeleton protein RodZ